MILKIVIILATNSAETLNKSSRILSEQHKLLTVIYVALLAELCMVFARKRPAHFIYKGTGPMAISFKMNGKAVSVDDDGEMPLLWAIRDNLKMTGTKFGCGIGYCGACSVMVNGELTRSCITPVEDVAGAEITTIEGLAAEGEATKVQEAWIKEQVPQCGYCQSGMIMAATSLLAEVPNPTDDDIDAAMTNICRCGSYPRVRKAIKRAAAAMQTGVSVGETANG